MASNAISTIVRYPDLTDMVTELTAIAQEEMEHFGMVLEKIKASKASHEEDDYVGQLSKFIKRGGSREGRRGPTVLAAMIEARCVNVSRCSPNASAIPTSPSSTAS